MITWEESLIKEENEYGPKAVSLFDDHSAHITSHAKYLNLNMFIHIANHVGLLIANQVIKPSFNLERELLVQRIRG